MTRWVGKGLLVALLLPMMTMEPALGEVSKKTPEKVPIRDLVSIEGVRENPLIGYGLVVGLNGTGDRRQTLFTTQTLANVLERLGVQIPAGSARVNNVAAVLVTASLPAFPRPGTTLDVTVSSIGDAKSLEGGLLVMTPLYGADGSVYAAAQGPITVGGYSAGGAGNSKQVNHPTMGRIPNGGIVERDAAPDLRAVTRVSLLLRQPDFATSQGIAEAINREFGREAAAARDSRLVEIAVAETGLRDAHQVLARVEGLVAEVHTPSRVVVNERTGTVVMGKDVRLGAVSILQGNLAIEIMTEYSVSQPAPFSGGKTEVVAQPSVRAQESPAKRVELEEGATVEQLVNGLQAMGATARDVIAILQAMKAAGALRAELEVI